MHSSGAKNDNPVVLPPVTAHMQARIEAGFLREQSLEQEIRTLRALHPLICTAPPPSGRILRALRRLIPALRRRHEVAMLRNSGLLDPEWYHARNPDVATLGLDPALHYWSHGAREGRDPGPHFKTSHYLAMYPDIVALGLNPLVHYLRAGWREGRSIRPEMPHRGDPAPQPAKPGTAAAPNAPSRPISYLDLGGMGQYGALFDLQTLPETRMRDPYEFMPTLCLGPGTALKGDALRTSRNRLLADLATRPVGIFVIDWAGLQDDPGEWAGLWSTDHMQLNRLVMDACRIALDRGWLIRVTGPVLRMHAPLYRSIASVAEEVSADGTALPGTEGAA